MDKYTIKLKKIYLFFILFFNDLFFLILAFLISFFIRFRFSFEENILDFINYYLLYSFIGIAVMLLLLVFFKLYNLDNIHPGTDANIKILLTAILGVFIISTLNFYINRDDYLLSRIWLVYVGIFSFLLLVIGRIIVRRIVNIFFKKIGIKRNVLIIGINEESRRIADTFRKVELDNANISGYVDSKKKLKTEDAFIKKFKDINVLGALDDIRFHILKYNIDTIVISTSDIKYDYLLKFLEDIKDFDIEILMSPSLFEFSVSRMRMFDYAGVPLIQISQVGQDWKIKLTKFLIDYSLGLVIFLFFLVLWPFLALAIKLDSKGPVFFRQERYGENFRKIKIYKLRTMVADAESNKAIINQIYDKKGGFKIKDDPRITKVGRFLRKSSLDEFPQIINVLRGELSIVGPRALAVEEGDLLEDWEKKRMSVKQGITGLWQVSGRSDLTYEERMKLDLFYIHNWSILLEIKIIFLTVMRVLFRKGAY